MAIKLLTQCVAAENAACDVITRSGAIMLPDLLGSECLFIWAVYFGCPVEPFSEPVPASDDVGGKRVSGAGLAGW